MNTHKTMNNSANTLFPAKRWFYLFLVVHLIGWTLVPILVRQNLPLDSIEGTVWGHQLEWGYDKNPFLNGWLTSLAAYLGGNSGWMIYLFSQLCVAGCLWVVWKLGKNMLTPAYALVAVLMLEGVQYFNFHAIDFNDNTLELGLWAFTIYFFYHALRKHSYRWWILTGFAAGLSMMAKYYTAALLAAMFLFLFHPIHEKKPYTVPSFYIGILAFFAVILPHIFWLFSHDFITVTYVFERASTTPSWRNHFFYPLQFLLQQGQAFLPALLLLSFLLLGKKPVRAPERLTPNRFDILFILFMGLGPILLTAFLSFCLGINLRAGWGMPLLSLWGLIVVMFLQPTLSRNKLIRFTSSVFLVMGLLLTLYSRSLTNSTSPSTANFPGQEIARVITKKWHETYHTPLAYVAGSRWLGGNIEFYSKDHPAVFIEWDKQKAPWIDLKKMQRKGAVFIWNLNEDEILPKAVKNRFPQLQKHFFMTFNWQRNKQHLMPLRIGIAYLPPQST